MREQSVNFDRAADFYDATRGFPEGEDQNVARFVAEVADLPASARVLEIGVGTGRIALPFSRYVAAYFGVDISEKMLGKLRDKQTDEPIYVCTGDAMKLPFPDATFDAVVIVHVLHLVKDPIAVLSEVVRVLKADGVVLNCQNIAHSGVDAITPLNEAWMNATRQVRKSRDQWHNMGELMHENGWTPANPPQTYTYKTTTTPQEFLNRVESRAWSSTWDMPQDIWQAGVDAVKAAINEHFNGEASIPVQQESGFEVEIYRC